MIGINNKEIFIKRGDYYPIKVRDTHDRYDGEECTNFEYFFEDNELDTVVQVSFTLLDDEILEDLVENSFTIRVNLPNKTFIDDFQVIY